MKTLREAKIGDTVTVVKLHGEGCGQAPDYGYGHYQGCTVHIRKVAPWAIRWRSRYGAMSCPCARLTLGWSRWSRTIFLARLGKAYLHIF